MGLNNHLPSLKCPKKRYFQQNLRSNEKIKNDICEFGECLQLMNRHSNEAKGCILYVARSILAELFIEKI